MSSFWVDALGVFPKPTCIFPIRVDRCCFLMACGANGRLQHATCESKPEPENLSPTFWAKQQLRARPADESGRVATAGDLFTPDFGGILQGLFLMRRLQVGNCLHSPTQLQTHAKHCLSKSVVCSGQFRV